MDILVAADRSDESQNALEHALDIGDMLDAAITVVHVVENVSTDSRSRIDESEANERGRSILEKASTQAVQRGLSIETEILVGDPTEVIPTYAESNAVDVIYVGHRGIPQKGEPIVDGDQDTLGSVAKGILQKTAVPVTIFDREI